MQELLAIQSSISLNTNQKQDKFNIQGFRKVSGAKLRMKGKKQEIGRRINTQNYMEKNNYQNNLLLSNNQQVFQGQKLQNQDQRQHLQFCDLVKNVQYATMSQSQSEEYCQQDEDILNAYNHSLEPNPVTNDANYHKMHRNNSKPKLEINKSQIEIKKNQHNPKPKPKNKNIKQILNFTYHTIPTSESNKSCKKSLKSIASYQSLLIKQISKNEDLQNKLSEANSQNKILRNIICEFYKKSSFSSANCNGNSKVMCMKKRNRKQEKNVTKKKNKNLENNQYHYRNCYEKQSCQKENGKSNISKNKKSNPYASYYSRNLLQTEPKAKSSFYK